MATKHETWLASGREITIHTAYDASGRVFVSAMRGPGESTRLLDGRAVDLPRLKVRALSEACERWGEPGRVGLRSLRGACDAVQGLGGPAESRRARASRGDRSTRPRPLPSPRPPTRRGCGLRMRSGPSADLPDAEIVGHLPSARARRGAK